MTRSDDRSAMQERILETADRLFYGQGIRAVGVDTIAAEIGISKRTLYNYFPSKDELIVAYLSRRLRPTPPSDLPPVQQILGNFERLERTFATRRASAAARSSMQWPSSRSRRTRPTRSLSPSRSSAACGSAACWRVLGVDDPDTLALQLQILADGAIAAALVRGDPKVAVAAGDAARVLLKAAGVKLPAAETRRRPRRR